MKQFLILINIMMSLTFIASNSSAKITITRQTLSGDQLKEFRERQRKQQEEFARQSNPQSGQSSYKRPTTPPVCDSSNRRGTDVQNLRQISDRVDEKYREAAQRAQARTKEISWDYNAKPLPPKLSAATAVSSGKSNGNIWADDPMISWYEKSPQVQKAIRAGLKRYGNVKSKLLCYRGTKYTLGAGGLVKYRPTGGYARDAIRDLEAQGHTNLLDIPEYRDKIRGNARNIPIGTVAVFRRKGNSRHPGDATIRIPGGFISDYRSPRPITEQPAGRKAQRMGEPYELVGVMINTQIIPKELGSLI